MSPVYTFPYFSEIRADWPADSVSVVRATVLEKDDIWNVPSLGTLGPSKKEYVAVMLRVWETVRGSNWPSVIISIQTDKHMSVRFKLTSRWVPE